MPDKPTRDEQPLVANEKPQASREEAQRLTDEIRADATALWAKLLDAYERKVHIALGYTAWSQYARAEFGQSKTHSYRMLEAAEVVRALSDPEPPPPPESPKGDSDTPVDWRAELRAEQRQRENQAQIDRMEDELMKSKVAPPTRLAQARALVPLANQRSHNELVDTWEQIVETYGPDVSGADVRRAVQARLEATTPPEQRLTERLQMFHYWFAYWHFPVIYQLSLALDADVPIEDDEGEKVEGDPLASAPPEFIEQWQTIAQEMNETLAHIMKRLAAVSDE